MVARLVALGSPATRDDHAFLLRQFGAHQRVGLARLAALAAVGAAFVGVEGLPVRRRSQQLGKLGERIGACARSASVGT